MYIATHRVVSKTAVEGINTFAYLAGERSWQMPEAHLDEQPGQLVHQSVEITPGGNRVRSYLDVVFPDSYTRDDVSWLLTTLPRLIDTTEFPHTGSLERAAWRFGLEFSLVPVWEDELVRLADHAHTTALSYLVIGSATPSTLSSLEVSGMKGAGRRGDTGAVIDLLRALARQGRIEAMVEAIGVYTKHVEVSAGSVAGFLRSRIPSILTNNYFSELGPQRFNDFITWCLANPTWGQELIEAAADSAVALRAAVTRVLDVSTNSG
ncbi:MAG: hypothetical protein HN348_35240 [Proteobacteria bacterium]|jgi:hypothetical protein|nr:hypothetical protein [Pseudomonadota bacterium]